MILFRRWPGQENARTPFVHLVRERGITPVIARRKTTHGSGLGTVRWVVERTFAWLHHFKRLLVRYAIRLRQAVR